MDRESYRLKIIAIPLICISGITAGAAEDSDRTNEFIEILKHYRGIGEPYGVSRANLRNILESRSFGYDIAPYVRAAATNRFKQIRADAMYMITAVGDKKLVPLIVDRFLHDETKWVRSAAIDNLLWFLAKTPRRELLDEKTIEAIGQKCMEHIKDGSELGKARYIKLIGKLEYRPAKELLVSLWKQTEGLVAANILRNLYAIDRENADQLLLQDGVRERMRSANLDTSWFLALSRSAQRNEKSLEIIKKILESIDKEKRKYQISGSYEYYGALLTHDEECRQWVWDVIEGEGKRINRWAAIYYLRKFDMEIIKTAQEKKALLKAIKNSKYLYKHVTQANPEDFEEGTIGRWLASSDSPLRDSSDKGGQQIEIGGMATPLFFEDSGITPATKQAIAEDIELVFSGVKTLEWVPESPPDQLRGLTTTHKLQGLGKDRKNLPEAIAECIEAGIGIDGVVHLVIPSELIKVYKQALEQKEKHPQMYAQLDDFIKLLENKERLREILEDEEKARDMVFCYHTGAEWSLDILENCVASGVDVRHPSLLTIKPLADFFKNASRVENVFIMWTRVTWKESGNTEIVPLGAYMDGQWRVLSYPIP